MPKSSTTSTGSKNIIWDYFKVCDIDKSKAICIVCKKILSRGSADPHKQTITGLKNHLKSQHSAICKRLFDVSDVQLAINIR